MLMGCLRNACTYVYLTLKNQIKETSFFTFCPIKWVLKNPGLFA